MERLITEYEIARQDTLRRLQTAIDDEERRIIRSMLSDLDYALQWMRDGKRPGTSRAIDRAEAYKREILFETNTLETAFATYVRDIQRDIEQAADGRIERALSCLKPTEKEAYIMAKAGMMTRRQIAQVLGLEREAVKKMVRRADKKIAKQLASD